MHKATHNPTNINMGISWGFFGGMKNETIWLTSIAHIESRLIYIDTGTPGLCCAHQQFGMGTGHFFVTGTDIIIGKFLTHRLGSQYDLMGFCHIDIAYDASLMTVAIETVRQVSIHIDLLKE